VTGFTRWVLGGELLEEFLFVRRNFERPLTASADARDHSLVQDRRADRSTRRD
jgi:hypothetical protein